MMPEPQPHKFTSFVEQKLQVIEFELKDLVDKMFSTLNAPH